MSTITDTDTNTVIPADLNIITILLNPHLKLEDQIADIATEIINYNDKLKQLSNNNNDLSIAVTIKTFCGDKTTK